MVDNIQLSTNVGAGSVLATDDIGGAHYQLIKLAFGPLDTGTLVTAAVGLPTDVLDRAARDLGKVDVALLDQYTPVDVDSGGGTLNALPVQLFSPGAGGIQIAGGGGTEATALRVTVASDSTGVLSVDFGGTAPSFGNGTSAGAVRVTLSNDSTGIVSLAASTASIGKLAANDGVDIGNVDVASVPAPLSVVGNGTSAAAMRVTISNDTTGQIKLAASSGTDIGKLSANDSVDIGDVTVNNAVGAGVYIRPGTGINLDTSAVTVTNGQTAHDSNITGSPLRIGAEAVTADPTSVATTDAVNLISTVGGKLITHPYAIPENLVSGSTSDITDTTHTSVVAATGSASTRNYITHLVVQNSHASTSTWVLIQDGDGGTTLYSVYALAGGGGASISFPAPLKQPTANTALYCECVTTGANVRVSASGFKAP